MQERLTFSQAGHHVRTSAEPARKPESLAIAVRSPLHFSDWWRSFGRGGLSGKTCPVSCHRTPDGILPPSSGRWLNAGMGGPGECWTLKASEFHNGAVASSLSRILET